MLSLGWPVVLPAFLAGYLCVGLALHTIDPIIKLVRVKIEEKIGVAVIAAVLLNGLMS